MVICDLPRGIFPGGASPFCHPWLRACYKDRSREWGKKIPIKRGCVFDRPSLASPGKMFPKNKSYLIYPSLKAVYVCSSWRRMNISSSWLYIRTMKFSKVFTNVNTEHEGQPWRLQKPLQKFHFLSNCLLLWKKKGDLGTASPPNPHGPNVWTVSYCFNYRNTHYDNDIAYCRVQIYPPYRREI